MPLPAWEAGWEPEHLPFDDLPWTLDPPDGFVASANNAPRPDGPDEPFLGVDWLDGYRAARIVEVLGERTGWDVPGSMALQTDTVSVPWRDLRDLVLASAPGDPAVELLRDWDGVVSADSAAASVYELLVAELACAMARADAPNGWRWAVGGGFGESVPRTSFGARTLSHLVGRLRSGRGVELIPAALATASAALRERHGTDPAGWAWGTIRPLRLLHPLGVRTPLDRIFNLGPVPLGGDANTPAQAGVHPARAARQPVGDREPPDGDRPRRPGAQPIRAGRRPVGEPALAALRRPVRAVAARRGRADRLGTGGDRCRHRRAARPATETSTAGRIDRCSTNWLNMLRSPPGVPAPRSVSA